MVIVHVGLGIETVFAFQLGGPLPEKNGKWHIVEDDADVESTDGLVDDTGKFVEARSLLEFNLLSIQLPLGWVVHDGLEGVALQGLEVHLADFDDDLEGHEMDDAVLDGVLVGQKVNIDALADDGGDDLVQAEEPSDGGTVALEQVCLLVGEFHDVQSLGNLWVEHKVERDGAWELDVEDGEAVTELIGVSSLLVASDRDVHAVKHKVHDALH